MVLRVLVSLVCLLVLPFTAMVSQGHAGGPPACAPTECAPPCAPAPCGPPPCPPPCNPQTWALPCLSICQGILAACLQCPSVIMSGILAPPPCRPRPCPPPCCPRAHVCTSVSRALVWASDVCASSPHAGTKGVRPYVLRRLGSPNASPWPTFRELQPTSMKTMRARPCFLRTGIAARHLRHRFLRSTRCCATP